MDVRRVLSGIIFVNRNGLFWRDAPREYGPHKTLDKRWKRWGEMGVVGRMMKFRQSSLSEFHVAVPDFECFLTRLEGSANPMGSSGGSELADEVSVVPEVSSCRAPHPGIVRAIRAVGDVVAKGDHIGDLMALDRATPIYAEADGSIFEGLVEGDFVEFDQAIAAIH